MRELELSMLWISARITPEPFVQLVVLPLWPRARASGRNGKDAVDDRTVLVCMVPMHGASAAEAARPATHL